MNPVVMEELISFKEAADLLGISEATVRRWFDAGKLRGHRTPSGRRRLLRESVEKLCDDLQKQHDPGITFR